MANVVKIYEVRSLGFNELMGELEKIEQQFKDIKAAKQALNKEKISTDDPTKLDAINKKLDEQKLKGKELLVVKQQLRNEIRALDIVRQKELLQLKQLKDAETAEAGSLTNLIARRKELRTLLSGVNPASGTPIFFGGQSLSFQQALDQFHGMNTQIGTMQKNLKGVGEVGNPVINALNNSFKSLRGNLGLMIAEWAGWFAILRGTAQLIGENLKLSDSFADLQIRMHGTKEDVDRLFESLKKIDTRTSLKDLVDIAAVVSKKGVAKEEIADLTREFDKLNVVLGKEIGEPATAVASIIKLISIFNEDRNITPERVERLGTSLFKLTTSGVATGEFLIGFAERVGAIRGITGLTIESILGMGAALQQLGQHEEVAGTAAVQLSTKLFSNVPKFAAAARVTVEEFRKLLDQDPFEALVKVAETLRNLKEDELAAEFEEVVQGFQDVNITGARIKAVLGDIATNADFVRDRMAKARVSTKDFSDQAEAVVLKQTTLAATFERVKKGFELAFTSKPVQIALSVIGSLLLLIANNLGIILPLLGLYASAWIIANAATVAAQIFTTFLNAQLALQGAATAIATTFTKAYSAALALMTGATTGATAATTLLSIALRLLPLGAIIALIALLVAGCNAATSAIKGTTEQLRREAVAMEALEEINSRANAAIADQITKLDELVAIATDVKLSYDVQRAALDELIGIYPAFHKALSDQTDQFGNLKIIQEQVIAISKLYREEIRLNAEATASAQLAAEQQKRHLLATTVRQRFERESAVGRRTEVIGEIFADQDQRAVFAEALGSTPAKAFTNEQIIQKLKAVEEKRFVDYSIYQSFSIENSKKLRAREEERKKEDEKAAAVTLQANIQRLRTSAATENELEAIIKAIDAEQAKLKEGNPKIAELEKAKLEFKARLDKLKNVNQKTRPYFGARIPGEERDVLSEIDALRDLELTEAQARQAQRQIDHRLTLGEELRFVIDINNINQRYLDQKIDFLEAQDSLNAKEKETLAKFKKDKLDLELKSLNDLQAIKDREFSFQKRLLDQQLKNEIAQEELKARTIELDPTRTPTERAEARKRTDEAILALQIKYNADIDRLEKNLNQKSTENAQKGADDVLKIKQDLIKDELDIVRGRIATIDEAADSVEAQIEARIAARVTEVLQSGKSNAEITRRIEEIRNEETRSLLVNEKVRAQLQLEVYKDALDKKLISEEKYQQALRRYKEAEAALAQDTVDKELSAMQKFVKALEDFVDSLVQNVLGIKKYTKDAQGDALKTADAISQATATVGRALDEAISGYFDRLRDRVDLERDVQQERLDNEEEQVKARAQSQSEIEHIDRQYDLRRKEIDKRAAEEKKKIALKEAAINFAVSVTKAIAQFGLPLALIPIAAQTLLYFVQRANIQAQQFAKGGLIPRFGGEVQGQSHAQGGVKFYPYEVQGKEIMIINDKSAQDSTVRTFIGTNKQVASAINKLGGGIEFSPGAAFTRKFAEGGLLGINYQAPVYTPTPLNNSTSSQDIISEIRNLANEQSKRIDRLEVVQTTKSVAEGLKKHVRQTSIGQL